MFPNKEMLDSSDDKEYGIIVMDWKLNQPVTSPVSLISTKNCFLQSSGGSDVCSENDFTITMKYDGMNIFISNV